MRRDIHGSVSSDRGIAATVLGGLSAARYRSFASKRFTRKPGKIVQTCPFLLHACPAIVLVQNLIHVALFDIPPPILIVISDPHGGLRIFNRRVLIEIRVGPIKTILVGMIEHATTVAFLLIGGGLLSPLSASSGCRSFATSRVGVLACLSQSSIRFCSQVFCSIYVLAGTSRKEAVDVLLVDKLVKALALIRLLEGALHCANLWRALLVAKSS